MKKAFFHLPIFLLLLPICSIGQMFWVPENIDTLNLKGYSFLFVKQWDTTKFDSKPPMYDTVKVVKFIETHLDSIYKTVLRVPALCSTQIKLYTKRKFITSWEFHYALEIKLLNYCRTDSLFKLKRYYSEDILLKNIYKKEKWFTETKLQRWLNRWHKALKRNLKREGFPPPVIEKRK